MHYIYCPQCGKKLTERPAGDDGMVPYCESCQRYWFDCFDSCIIALVYNEYDEILLERQSYLSSQYMTFVSGYITPGESAEECAYREIKEETGIEAEKLVLICTEWFARREQLMHGFIAFARKAEITCSKEIDEARWIDYREAQQYMFPITNKSTLSTLYRRFCKEKEEGLR